MAAVSDPIPSLADLHAVGAAQQPTYPDPDEVARVVKALRTRPPLVFARGGRILITLWNEPSVPARMPRSRRRLTT